MAAEGDNVEPELLAEQRDHGHYFARKSFARPTYCHHCCEMLWGVLGMNTGYTCEVCNFTCHERCLKTVASYCSGVALQLVKNPVAHSWSQPAKVPQRFCCVCRKRTDKDGGMLTLECEICEYYVHVDCQDLAVSDCREATTYGAQSQHHHWREGNVPVASECVVCKKACYSTKCLAGMRCEWCGMTAHASCYRQTSPECDFGLLNKIMLPPNCLSIPRTELPMELLLNLHRSDKAAPPTTSASGKVAPDDSSLGSSDDAKEKDDSEILRIFDGNNALRNSSYRTATVAKNATLPQIKDAALRTFHIQDQPGAYYLTQTMDDDGAEEDLIEDPCPLRTLRRPDGKRPQIILRYREQDSNKTTIKVYGSWLRIPVTFCSLTVTKHVTVSACISEALAKFGLDRHSAALYQLVEVSLDRGVVERTVGDNENILDLVQNLRKESLRRHELVRFYLQEKEDPHGSTVSVFVANLPQYPIQRQYEQLLLNLLGCDQRPFTKIGPIYYEYGSLVITFDGPKAATSAVLKLQSVNYENDGKPLLVLCLPNIEASMIPANVEPLMVLVNVKSGGGEGQGQGEELMRAFRKLLNPFQVFDVLKGGPQVGMYVFRTIPKYRILVCGGDGTVGWVLNCLDNVKQDSACFLPPCGIVPVGTGNDLGRVLKWGDGFRGIHIDIPLEILKDVTEAEEIMLDRWTVVFHQEERTKVPNAPTNPNNPIIPPDPIMNPEEQTQLLTMNNYFGIGIDADVCLAFDEKRKQFPDRFSNRYKNKFYYFQAGLEKMFHNHDCKDLYKKIDLDVEGRKVDIAPNIEGLIILNITSFASGAEPWGPRKEEAGFQKPSLNDGKLEVVGLTGVRHLGLVGSKMSTGIRVAQGKSIRIVTREALPVQVDGEPKLRQPGTITILHSALKATMLKKVKSKALRRNTAPPTPSAQRATHSDGAPAPGAQASLGPPSSSLVHGRSAPDDLSSTGDDGDTFL